MSDSKVVTVEQAEKIVAGFLTENEAGLTMTELTAKVVGNKTGVTNLMTPLNNLMKRGLVMRLGTGKWVAIKK